MTRILGLPTARSGVLLAPGTSDVVDVRFNIMNLFVQEKTNGETLILDGETWETTLAFSRGTLLWGRPVELSVELPWVVHSSGELDSPIDRFHEFFGLTDGERDLVLTDRFLFYYLRDGQEQFHLTHRVQGLGDLRVSVAIPLLSGSRAGNDTALYVGLKAPTGDSDTLLGSGAWGLSSLLAATRRFDAYGRPMSIYGNIAAILTERAGILASIRNPIVLMAEAGIGVHMSETLELGIDLRTHSAPYRSTSTRAMGSIALSTVFGATWSVGKTKRFELALVEDLDGLATPDVTLHMSLSGQF